LSGWHQETGQYQLAFFVIKNTFFSS
jgi:hypothetical protein